MEYIIDGYNLIKSSFLSKYESRGISYSIQMFINILADYHRKHPSISFTAIFDGGSPLPQVIPYEKRIRVLFSGDISADEVIRKSVEKAPEKNISKTVVSNDREVRAAGRLFGARVMGVVEFLNIVCPPVKAKTKSKTKKDINMLGIEKELKRHYKI
ncbi:MAG: hypothetical protein GX554_03865 [Elusimicrobia bacterium]|jgi:predicted RNA-binding protein with PIN domain|nr:hypothetical protein [Elusimicrobiota bacterium]